MDNLRFAILGTGFWAQFQLAGWLEVGGVDCVAFYNRTVSKAETLAERFGVPNVYGDAEELLQSEDVDFIDIITDVDTHAPFVELAAKYGKPVICQKPMAPDLATARRMVASCRQAGVPLMIHENWRWQYPIRQFARLLRSGVAGKPFRAHVIYANSFPVFDNQPFLKELDQFILADIGSHILDTSRFLFGDARRLYCQTTRITPDIAGEDMATVMMETVEDITVICSMSYASRTERERFPETYIEVECSEGSIELGPDFWIRVTTAEGTLARRYPPSRYAWADPAYDIVHASIVDCNADLLRSLRTGDPAETSADDNLKTIELVFGAYASAASGQSVIPGGVGLQS